MRDASSRSLVENVVDDIRIKGCERHEMRMHCLIGDGRAKKPMRRSDTGAGRHDDLGNPELLRDAAGMQRCRSAGRDEHPRFDLVAMIGGVNAGCIGHILVDDFDETRSGRRDVDRHRLGEMDSDRGARLFGIERHRAAGESVGIELAEKRDRHR